MGVIDYIQSLFLKSPRSHTTAYGTLYRALVARLRDSGMKVGKGAAVPRIEVHSIQEGERMDKEGCLRDFTVIIECISNSSEGRCAEMHDQCLSLLTYRELDLGDGWRCVGVVPEQLQDMTESSDTDKIIYRLLQTYRVYVERVKS